MVKKQLKVTLPEIRPESRKRSKSASRIDRSSCKSALFGHICHSRNHVHIRLFFQLGTSTQNLASNTGMGQKININRQIRWKHDSRWVNASIQVTENYRNKTSVFLVSSHLDNANQKPCTETKYREKIISVIATKMICFIWYAIHRSW